MVCKVHMQCFEHVLGSLQEVCHAEAYLGRAGPFVVVVVVECFNLLQSCTEKHYW